MEDLLTASAVSLSANKARGTLTTLCPHDRNATHVARGKHICCILRRSLRSGQGHYPRRRGNATLRRPDAASLTLPKRSLLPRGLQAHAFRASSTAPASINGCCTTTSAANGGSMQPLRNCASAKFSTPLTNRAVALSKQMVHEKRYKPLSVSTSMRYALILA